MLICATQRSLVHSKHACIKWLKQARRPLGRYDQPEMGCAARAQRIWSEVDSSHIHEHHDLHVACEHTTSCQGTCDLANEACSKRSCVPNSTLADQSCISAGALDAERRCRATALSTCRRSRSSATRLARRCGRTARPRVTNSGTASILVRVAPSSAHPLPRGEHWATTTTCVHAHGRPVNVHPQQCLVAIDS